MTFAQLQSIKTRIVRDLEGHVNSKDAAIAQFTTIKAALTNMQSQYAGWASEVNAYLAANPNDAAAEALKAEKDIYVAEFAALKTLVTSLETAVAGV